MKKIYIVCVLILLILGSLCYFIRSKEAPVLLQSLNFSRSTTTAMTYFIPMPTTTATSGELSLLTKSTPMDCPIGTEKFLSDQKLKSNHLECKSILMSGETVRVLNIIYFRLGYDVIWSKQTTVLLTSDGKLIPYDDLVKLLYKLNYFAQTEIDKLYGNPRNTGNINDPSIWHRVSEKPGVMLRGKMEGPIPNGDYCGIFVAIPPAKGTLEVCGKDDQELPRVIGKVTLGENVYPIAQARLKGDAVALAKYSSLGVEKEHLRTYVNDIVYRPEFSDWIFSLNLWQDKEEVKHKTAEYLTDIIVKVKKDGTACVVKTLRAEVGRHQPLTEDNYPCSE
ncbi:MAG: hypothetical protein WCT49_05515 [Candidatus Paceibacterota bacterium]|jgi:hypothetical protein